MKSPIIAVKERFGDKEKLVSAVQKLAQADLWLDRVSPAKGLSRVSNAKLLRLHDALTDATKRFGTRAKLIDAILDLENRKQDQGLRSRLEGHALPRLLDVHRAASRRQKAKASAPVAASAPEKKKPARSRKAQAKAKAAAPKK